MVQRQPITKRRRRRTDPLLEELLAGLPCTTVREAHIRHDHLFVFGQHDARDGSLTLNLPLCRVMIFLHEALHRARPSWSERSVRTRTTQLLRGLDDDQVGQLNAALLAVIDRS